MIESVPITSNSPKIWRRSESSRIPRLGVLPMESAASATSRDTGLCRPVAAGRVSHGEECLPDVRVAVRPRPSGISGEMWRDLAREHCLAQAASPGRVGRCPPGRASRPGRFDELAGRAPAHRHDDRARQDGFGQPAEPGQRHGAEGGISSVSTILPRTTQRPATAPAAVSGVEQRAEFFVVLLRLRAEDGVDLVDRRCRRPSRSATLRNR